MKTLTLTFDDWDDEVVVRISPVSLRDLLDIEGKATSVLPLSELGQLAEQFKPYVETWKPKAAFLDRDPNLLLSVILGWVRGVSQVPLPLPREFSGIEPSASTSPENSPEPSSSTTS